ARRLSGVSAEGPERLERDRAALRAAYLGARRAELASSARSRVADVRVGGEPGRWIARAIGLARSVRELRGELSQGDAIAIGDLDALGRARWLTALVGSPAARWSLAAFADASDDAWWVALAPLVPD